MLDLFYGEEISGVTEEEKDEILSTLNQNNDGQSNSIPIGQENTDGQNQKRDRSGDRSGDERGSESGRGTEGQEGTEVKEPHPIGRGVFGNIYDQFKGKAKKAFDFLVKHKDGDLLGVFHRDEVGDIDLVWGDVKGGAHRKNIRDKGKKIADKNWVLTAYDLDSADGTSAISTKKSRQAARATDKSVYKDTKESADESGTNENIPNQSPSQPKSILERAKEAAADYNVQREIKAAEAVTYTNSSDAQKEAGNYRKGKVSLDGYTISIENPKGSERSGTDNNGKKWTSKMNNTYGFIRGTEGNDKDHLDVFLGDNAATGNVYVVDQSNEDGSFDEHKIMYGFNSVEEAREAYLSNYEAGWEILIMGITPVSKEGFKSWTDNGKKKSIHRSDEGCEERSPAEGGCGICR